MLRATPLELKGKRVTLRPLTGADWDQWREVRYRSRDWLVKWESRPAPGHPDPADDRRAFLARCGARDRERELGAGFGFGIFTDGQLAGEINLNSIQRGSFQNAYVGYWIDHHHAGRGLMPESLVTLMRFAFEDLGLHRVQVSIIPRNGPSRRVVEKVGLRHEGVAERYLEINGVWEDHMRFALTAEEWQARRDDLLGAWVLSRPGG